MTGLVFSGPVDLAQPRLGSRVVFASDDFFADKSRLIKPEEPVFITGKYDDNGKWMDGWESRRKRTDGYDYAIVRLGCPGIVEHFEIDTRHFTGNFPPAASIDLCTSHEDVPSADADWREAVTVTALQGNDRLTIAAVQPREATHIRLNIYPDGGVARLRVFGRIEPRSETGATIDLAAMANGGRAIVANDAHFGALSNLIAPGRGVNMGDGWETRRRREPGYDWGILKLAVPGRVEEVLVDTAHFKGNFPDRCSLQGAPDSSLPDETLAANAHSWPVLLPETKLQAHSEHTFRDEILPHPPVRFVRFNIYPDGGVSRLRIVGRPQM